MTKSVYGNVRLDAETAQLLANLAQPFEGNKSMALRAAIKGEAARRGIISVPANSQPQSVGRRQDDREVTGRGWTTEDGRSFSREQQGVTA